MKASKILLFLFLTQINFSYAVDLFGYLNSINNEEQLRTRLTTSETSKLLENVDEIFSAAISKDSEFEGYTPVFLSDDYHDIAFSLYSEGFAKLRFYETFKKNYAKLSELKVPKGSDPKKFWQGQYQNIFKTYLASIQASPESCAVEGENATARKCCAGLLKLTLHQNTRISSLNQNAKKSGQVCNTQSDCQSGLCNKISVDKPGVCTSVKACYALQTLGGDCSGNRPYCGKGSCLNINKANLGVGECRAEAKSCESDIECCSNKCSNKKCVRNAVCTDCVGSGAKPARGQTCCPGNYLAPSGKCRIIFRPLVPRTSEVKEKRTPSFFKILISQLFISSSFAQSSAVCSGDNALTSAQRELIATKGAECRAQHRAGGSELSDCLRSVDDLQASFCRDSQKVLTDAEQSSIEARRAACVQAHAAGSDELNTCLAEVKTAENLIREQGAESSGENRYEDFQRQYNIPTVTAKTYSDARKCEFRAFNDNWKASSNTERNAEIFLRAFEYTFAGTGTQDYWEQQGKGNIFKRANKAALVLRENRVRMVKRAAEIDKEITCKCIAIYGPSEFSTEKQSYFNQNCAAEAASLRSSLGAGITDARGQDGKDAGESQIDGTSINTENDVQATQASAEEIDKGALGLSYERLLIEYLELRAGAQVDRFVDGEDLSGDLNELSEFISDKDFGEVWKDEIDGKNLDYHSPRGDSRLLYKWGFRYLGGLLAIILTVIAIGVGIWAGPALLAALIGKTAAVIAGGTVAGVFGGAIGLGTGLLIAGVIGAFGGKATPGAYDLEKVKKKKYNLLYKYDGFEKWYVGPKYDNKSNITETRCNVFAKASACLKSAYAFTDSDMKYLTTVPGTGHFIVDPKVPPFVDPSKISTTGMPIYNKTWVSIINTAVNEGVDYLRTTKPTSKRSKDGYTITKKSFAKRDIMGEALEKKYFIPLRGKFSAKTFDFKTAITNGAFKYATCKELNAGSCKLDGVSADAIGFGYLFESEEEAREFARYVYEMHYVYSSVTKEAELGYPLLGTDVYFQSVAYNIKLVTSLAAQRAQNYGQASALYIDDWEARASNYESLGEATLGNANGSSRNIRYTPSFFNAFRALDFSGAARVESFEALQANSAGTGGAAGSGFNSAEVAALSAGQRQIARINDDIAKAEAFDTSVGNTAEGQLRASNISNAGSALFSGAGSTASSNIKGAGSGAPSTSSLLGSLNNTNLNKSDAGEKDKESSAKSQGNSSGSASLNTGAAGNSNGFGHGGINDIDFFGDDSTASSVSSKTRVKDQGLSPSAADTLIKALANDSSLKTNFESDSIFDVVSKAYKRNYSKVLLSSEDFVKKEVFDDKPTDAETKELRQLLKSN